VEEVHCDRKVYGKSLDHLDIDHHLFVLEPEIVCGQYYPYSQQAD
jgi:hypothetical protein